MQADPSVTQIEIPPVREVGPKSILIWLALGWNDMRRAGFPSLLHGLLVTVASLAIVAITLMFWELLPGAVSGFLMAGPYLATGLYALSKQLDEDKKPMLRDATHAWINGSKCLLRFTLLLVISGTAWVTFSVLMFHFFIDTKIEGPVDFLRYVLTQGDDHFLLWTLLGGLGSALAFALTVISVPMLVDRDVTTRLAMLSSLRAVGHNPLTMFCWAMVILFATGLSFATLMLGFIVLYPLMGHASWHVYRDLVDVSTLPPRPAIK